jgi:hypothetical protein
MIMINPPSIAAKGDIPISIRTNSSDSITMSKGMLLDRSKELLSSLKDLFHWWLHNQIKKQMKMQMKMQMKKEITRRKRSSYSSR